MGTLRFVYDNKNNEVSLLSKHYSKDFENVGLQAIAASVVIFYAERPDASNSSLWQQDQQKDIPASLSMIPAPLHLLNLQGQHPDVLNKELYMASMGARTGRRASDQGGCHINSREDYGGMEGMANQYQSPGEYYGMRRGSRQQMSERGCMQDGITTSPSSSIEVVDADASMPESSAPLPAGPPPAPHMENGMGGAGPSEDFSQAGGKEGNGTRGRGFGSADYDGVTESVPSGPQETCVRTDGFVMQLQPPMMSSSSASTEHPNNSAPNGHSNGLNSSANCDQEKDEAAQGSVESPGVSYIGPQGPAERRVSESYPAHTMTSADGNASSMAPPICVDDNGCRQNGSREDPGPQSSSTASAPGCVVPPCSAAPPSSTMAAAGSNGEPHMYPGHAMDGHVDMSPAALHSRMEMGRGHPAVFPPREAMGLHAAHPLHIQDHARNEHLDNMMQIDLTEIKMEPVDQDLLVEAHMMPPGPSATRRRTFHGFMPEAMLAAARDGAAAGGSLDAELFAAHPSAAGVFRMPAQVGRNLAPGQLPSSPRKSSSKGQKDSSKHTARTRRSARCALCSGGIYCLMDYLKHLHMHRNLLENSNSYSCPVCLKSSQSYMEMAKVHVAMHIDKDSHVCPVCGTQITRKDALKRHFMLLHPSHMDQFASYSLQLSGLLSDAWKKLAPKPQASAPATPSRQMLNHSTTCSFCQLTVDSKDDFMTHVEMHSCLSPEFKCPICLQVFSTRCHLTRHAACHLTKEWVCPLCFQTFARSDSYNRHMRNMHRKNDSTPPSAALSAAPSAEPVPSS